MSSVMIKCPNTGRPVSTGIEVEPSVFRVLPKTTGRMRCMACGQEHAWSIGSAWLANEPRLLPVELPTGSEAA